MLTLALQALAPAPAGRHQPPPVNLRLTARAMLLVVPAVLAALVLIAAWMPIGSITIDEVVYALMVRDFADHGSRLIHAADLPFATLDAGVTQTHLRPDGRLAPQYPPLLADMLRPLFDLIGFRALFVANLVAFCASSFMVWLLAERLTASRALSWAAAGVFALGGFSLSYALAAWPHMVALAFVLAGTLGQLAAVDQERRLHRTGIALVSGLVLGFGVGIRIDTVLAALALAALPLFLRPARFSAAIGFLIGLAVPLALIGAINCGRFGTCSPISYGYEAGFGGNTNPARHLLLASVAASGAFGLWILTRLRRPMLRAVLAGLGVLLVAGLAVAGPESLRATLQKGGQGFVDILLDMPRVPAERIGDLQVPMGDFTGVMAEGHQITAGDGQRVFVHTFKKALLQNAPWLPLALFAFAAGGLLPACRQSLFRALMLVPAAYAGFYVMTRWDGGLATNMRYLLPVLPFAAIGAVIALAGLWQSLTASRRRQLLPVLLGLGAAAAVVMLLGGHGSIWWRQRAILDMPLILAAGLSASLLWVVLQRRRAPALAAALMLGSVSLAWGIAQGSLYDLPRDLATRRLTERIADSLGSVVPDGAVILFGSQGPRQDLVSILPAVIDRRLTVLRPSESGWRDLPRIARSLRSRRVPVFLVAQMQEQVRMRQIFLDLGVPTSVVSMPDPLRPERPYAIERVEWGALERSDLDSFAITGPQEPLTREGSLLRPEGAGGGQRLIRSLSPALPTPPRVMQN